MKNDLMELLDPHLTRRQLVWAVIALAVAAIIGVVVTTSIVSATKSTEVRGTQVDNTKTLNYSKETLQLLKDCIEPGGKCYERSQENTAGAVSSITQYAVYAAVCVDEPGRQTVEQTTACIIRLVKAEEAAQKESSDD